jgi:hypothetical protein
MLSSRPIPLVHGLGHPLPRPEGCVARGSARLSDAKPRHHTNSRNLGTKLSPKLAECFCGRLSSALRANAVVLRFGHALRSGWHEVKNGQDAAASPPTSSASSLHLRCAHRSASAMRSLRSCCASSQSWPRPVSSRATELRPPPCRENQASQCRGL